MDSRGLRLTDCVPECVLKSFRAGGPGGVRQQDLGHPHPAGLVYGIDAAPAPGLDHPGGEAYPARGGALHPAEGLVGGGGVGHPVVKGAGDPAAEILGQRVPRPPCG